MIKIALVDDHVLLRKSLANMLQQRGFPVVLQADNGKQFIEGLQHNELPDVVLMDINMPVMDGYAASQWVRTNHPGIRILALSVYDDENAIIRMLHSGARGYVLKDCEPEELTSAIEILAEKCIYHSELVSSKLMHKLQNGSAAGNAGNALNLRLVLTEKEKEFLRLNCSEMTYKEIAAKMGISPRTVDGYRDQLFEKLDIKSRVGLVLFAIKNKLIEI
jgi:DNA-binding NarL/FixJ family response regulator